ncbi:MAG: sodium:calcium antiporter [Pseudomonadota bacterium]|nr:sodium:calcium antiporter [Pseudomonadota bacterium]
MSPISATLTFLLCAPLIALAGVRIVALSDRLADRTGLGEALIGALLLGGTTSLSGSVLSVTASLQGAPGIAISNCLGGIAAQTAFLGLADIAYRRANLEHAAASAENLTQGTLLLVLLALPVFAYSMPSATWAGIHWISPTLLGLYLFGLRLMSHAHRQPMWHPHRTGDTREDVPDVPPAQERLSRLWLGFGGYAVLLSASGFALSEAAQVLTLEAGLSPTLVGGLFTAVTTSLPELIVAITAVRRGALNLAVGNIIGGNCFDVLFLAFSDVAYRSGSLYHAIDQNQLALLSLTMVMTGVLLLGLLRRERYGFANIGFESTLVLLLYCVGFTAIQLA